MPLCEVIYVKHKSGNGWKWRPVTADCKAEPSEKTAEPSEKMAEPSEKTYELFYECVAAARASGYTPNRKCL
jgi:hypothetical protein